VGARSGDSLDLEDGMTVEISAKFDGPHGQDYSGLVAVTVKGEARAAVEAMRAVVGKQGVGVPTQARITGRACNTGSASFTIWAVGSEHTPGREVTAVEAARIGRALLEQLGVTVRAPEESAP